MSGYIFSCPECGYRDDEKAFSISLCGECWCPKCDEYFIFEPEDEEDEEDEEE